jgi:hypothetical protein
MGFYSLRFPSQVGKYYFGRNQSPEVLLSVISIGMLQPKNYVTRLFRFLDKFIFLLFFWTAHLIQG